MTALAYPMIDKARPTPAWIETVRRAYPTEREWDAILTAKLKRRAGPGYSPLTVEAIVAGLEALLRAEIGGDFTVSDARWLAGGASKLQIAFWLDWNRPGAGRMRERMVLRMELPESVVETSRRREFDLCRAIGDTLPVPEALWIDADATHLPWPAIVCGFVTGVTKPSGKTSVVTGIGINFGEALRAPLGQQVIEDLAKLHRWDWRAADLPSFSRPSEGTTQAVEWNLNHWARVWEEDVGEEVPMMRLVERWLRRNMPVVDHLSMTHNDFRAGNFLFDEGTRRITAWLDWELACIGDRHQDVAFLALENMGHYAEDGSTFLCNGFVTLDALCAAYEAASGWPVDRAKVDYYRVLMCYRAVVIVLATGCRAGFAGKTHQDLTLAWLSAFAFRNLEEARQIIERVG